MTALKYGFLKCACVIRDFVARHYNSGVAREFKRSSCAALRSNAPKNTSVKSSRSELQSVSQKAFQVIAKNEFVKSFKNAPKSASSSHVIRALLSLFVACVTLLAAFVIAPTSALSANQSSSKETGSERAVDANAGSAKDGSSKVSSSDTSSFKTDSDKKSLKQKNETNNIEHAKSNTDSSKDLLNNKELKSVENQNLADSSVNKTNSTDSVSRKNSVGSDSTDASSNMYRSAGGTPELHAACKSNKKYNTFAKCYSITYSGKSIIKGTEDKPYNRVPQILTPTIKVAGNVQQTLPDGVWLELKQYTTKEDAVKYAFFKDNSGSYTVQSTNGVSNSDGSIRFFANKWMAAHTYKFKFVIHYPDGSSSKPKSISEKLDEKDLPKAKLGDLTPSLYDFGKEQDGTAVSGNKITIKPKSKGVAGSTTGGTDKKDTYDSINKLFIDSQSKDKPGVIHHHMICNKSGSTDYTVDSVNGLSLGTQTQFKHMEGTRPDGAKDSAVYESDDYTERSQSSISGTPKDDGTFVCAVFAVKDVKLDLKAGGGKITYPSTLVKEFDTKVATFAGKESLFKGNIVGENWNDSSSIKQGVDWDYKTVTIQFGGKDLALKVYPFKNANGSLPDALADRSDSFSLIQGAEIKPFIDAVSQSNNSKITLRMLCSKGEKKNDAAGGAGGASTGGTGSTGSSSAVSDSSGDTSSNGSQPNEPSESSQDSKNLEYKNWSTSIAGLGVTLPSDQEPCVTDSKGNTQCTSSDNKNVAARTDIEASITPKEVGDYQCVVYALKQNVLESDAWKAYETSFKNNSVIPNGDSLLEGSNKAKFADFKQGTDWQKYMLKIQVVKFSLPNAGARGWNMFLSVLSALVASLIAIYFVSDSIKRYHSMLNGRRRC